MKQIVVNLVNRVGCKVNRICCVCLFHFNWSRKRNLTGQMCFALNQLKHSYYEKDSFFFIHKPCSHRVMNLHQPGDSWAKLILGLPSVKASWLVDSVSSSGYVIVAHTKKIFAKVAVFLSAFVQIIQMLYNH